MLGYLLQNSRNFIPPICIAPVFARVDFMLRNKGISLPRSAIELAVQLFCIPVDGRKSESKDRLESTLESKILEERTSLMRLETWS